MRAEFSVPLAESRQLSVTVPFLHLRQWAHGKVAGMHSNRLCIRPSIFLLVDCSRTGSRACKLRDPEQTCSESITHEPKYHCNDAR
jgi:hypothetical protein